jgi:hypothetical protein
MAVAVMAVAVAAVAAMAAGLRMGEVRVMH